MKLIGKGVRSSTVYEPILNAEQLRQLQASPAQEPFNGDASKFRLGVEAMRLGLAYEYDPYFSLSIARVDPMATVPTKNLIASDYLIVHRGRNDKERLERSIRFSEATLIGPRYNNEG